MRGRPLRKAIKADPDRVWLPSSAASRPGINMWGPCNLKISQSSTFAKNQQHSATIASSEFSIAAIWNVHLKGITTQLQRNPFLHGLNQSC